MACKRELSIRFKTERSRTLYDQIKERIEQYEERERLAEETNNHKYTALNVAKMEELDWVIDLMYKTFTREN